MFHVRQWGVWADKAGLNARTRTSTFEPCPSRPTVVLCPPPPRSDPPPDAQGTEPGVEPPPGHQMQMQRGRRFGATQPLRETARRKRRRSAIRRRHEAKAAYGEGSQPRREPPRRWGEAGTGEGRRMKPFEYGRTRRGALWKDPV